MRMPSLAVSLGLLLVRGFFLLSRLNSNAKARTLLPQFQPQQDALEKARDARQKADNAVLFARGPVIEANETVAVFITTFQLDVLKVVGKNFDDPLYKILFPKGLTEVRKLAGQALCDELVRIATRLQELPKGHPLLVHLPQLNTLIKDYAAPLKALKTAMEVREAADVAVTTAKAAWRTAYDAIAGALRQMFAGRKSYQESFFLPEARPSAKKKMPESVVPVV